VLKSWHRRTDAPRVTTVEEPTMESRSQIVTRVKRRWLLAFASVGTLVVFSQFHVSPARAQSASNRALGIDRFRLSTDREGLLDVEGGWIPRAGSWNASLYGDYSDDPLVVRDADTDERLGSPVHRRLGSALGFAYAVTDRFQVAAALPLVFWQEGHQTIPGVVGLPERSLGTAGLGNLRLIPKLGLVQSPGGAVALALLAHVVIPTFQTNGYFGDDRFGVEPELAGSAALGPVRLAANVGYRWRAGTPTLLGSTIHDDLAVRAGVGYRFGGVDAAAGGPFELDVTFAGATAAKDLFGASVQNAAALAAGLQYDTAAPLTVFAGGGMGLAPAYGVPDFHLLAGVRFWTRPTPPAAVAPVDDDADRDGVRGAADGCPTAAEDKDGFEDGDGCPDPDNDKDGVPDGDDGCPTEAGVVENKGCPDKDRDGDGVVDRLDRCPEEREDKDGFEDDDGCPDPDNDKDGIADADDACPTEAGLAETKGCPDKDRDGDTVVDRKDNCPDEAGDPANSGCKTKQLARITDSGIEIGDTVYFKVDRDVIQKKSYPLLENVAQVIKNHPEAGVIRIEGHTDSRGDDQHNQALSEKRAQAVLVFLAGKGVPRERLTARGFGESQPLADNKTADGRAKNRRVVFAKEAATANPVAP
jgi:outer membrane protein OmpA-like peptidoglycan-associated protein